MTSPTGWVMGLVWALPIAPLVWTARGAARACRARHARRPGAPPGSRCALPPPFAGWAALAGTALVVAAARCAADAWRRSGAA